MSILRSTSGGQAYWPARRLVPGMWELPAGFTGGGISNQTIPTGQGTAVPFDLPEPCVVSRLQWAMSADQAAATLMRFALLLLDEQALTVRQVVPGSEVVVSLPAGTTAAPILTPALACPLPAGRVWAYLETDTAAAGASTSTGSQSLDMPAGGSPGQSGILPIGLRFPRAFGPLSGGIPAGIRSWNNGGRVAFLGLQIGGTP